MIFRVLLTFIFIISISCTDLSKKKAAGISNNENDSSKCTNGAINYPVCNQCQDKHVYLNSKCVTPCSNVAINPPECNKCPDSFDMIEGFCKDTTDEVLAVIGTLLKVPFY